jgi:hypothetical protein
MATSFEGLQLASGEKLLLVSKGCAPDTDEED